MCAQAVIDNRSGKVSKQSFPFLDLKAQFVGIRDETIAAVLRVLESQHFILGPEVQAFEKEFAAQFNCNSAAGCASGSDALLLALMALEIGAGDEVITTPFTFVATAGSIARLGARPVFVDIDPRTYNINPALIAQAITPRTRAIMPVHLFGLPAEMNAILDIAQAHGLAVVEDAAQAVSAQYDGTFAGTLGTFGCFSFFPSKNLGGAGDGGIITTNDSALADRVRVLRTHGSRRKYEYEYLGMNSRLDAMQAAILRIKLRHLAEWTEARRKNAEDYCQLINEFGLQERIFVPFVPRSSFHVYNQFVIRAQNRDELQQSLRDAGIPTETYYPSPLHLQGAFRSLGYKSGDFPEAELACQEVVALPIFPELTTEQKVQVVAAIAHFYRAC